MKNHFLIPYAGNKRQEVERIYNTLDFENAEYIIEPFCGTSALSFYIWKTHPRGGEFKYILNDNDKLLISLYRVAMDDMKWLEFINTINNICFNGDDFVEKNEYKDIVNQPTLEAYYIKNKYYNMRPGIYPANKTTKRQLVNYCDEFRTFLKTANIELINGDALELFKEYKDFNNAVVFIDPPYMNLYNSFYECGGGDIYEYLGTYGGKPECKFCCVINDTWIARIIFKKYNIIEYNKTYEMTKRKVKHLLIT